MKKDIISIAVSSDNLTRCSSCSRHNHIDRELGTAELLSLNCVFCGESLINKAAKPTKVNPFSRSAKLSIGLLSASLVFGACDDDDEVIEGPSAGESVQAGESMSGGQEEPLAGEEMPQPAGVEMQTAGEPIVEALYGAPSPEPAGEEMPNAGEEMPEPAGVEMQTAGEPMMEALYGAPPPESGSEEASAGDESNDG